MPNTLRQASAAVRASVSPNEQVKVYARGQMTTLGKGWSFDIAEPAMTGAETLLGVLVSDVLGLFTRLARRARVSVDEVEATATVQLVDPLVHLGVIGSEGTPRYEAFILRAYLGTSASESTVRHLWEETLRRAPLYQTLHRAGLVKAHFQLTA